MIADELQHNPSQTVSERLFRRPDLRVTWMDMMKINEKDCFHLGSCDVNTPATLCGLCSLWLCNGKFEKYTAIAVQDVQDGSFLLNSRVRILMDSEKRGCPLCSTILLSIKSHASIQLPEHEILSSAMLYSLYLLPDVPGWTIKVVFNTSSEVLRADLRLVPCERNKPRDSNVAPQWRLDSHIHDGGEAGMCFQRPHGRCGYRLDTRCAVAQTRVWLETCKSHHKSCSGLNRGFHNGQNLFRLLFLGDQDTPDARLVDVDVTDLELDYVTMSHRWGLLTKVTETTKAKLGSAYQKVSLEVYPKHFRDAMLFTKQLGFKYIWIDSLCIVQNCQEDWSKQAMLMHQIYSNGALNLAFLPSLADEELADRACAISEVPGCKITLLDSDRVNQHYVCWKTENFDHVLERSSLYSRAWTFQERILSPKTVHFGKQLYWECCSLRASTAFPSGGDYPGDFVDDHVLRLKQLLPHPAEEVAASLHTTWCSVVREYSGRDLTKPGDKLIALSGVAARLRQVYSLAETDYFFGLWKPCMPEQLLWGVEDDQHLGTEETHAGPSWSWASHKRPSKFTSVYLGTGIFRERLAAVVAYPVVEEGIFAENRDESPTNAWPSMQLSGMLILMNSSIPANVVVEFDFRLREPASSIYILPILGDLGTIYGLVLELVSATNNVVYSCSSFRRVGLFTCHQGTITELLSKQQPRIQSSQDWATLRKLQTSTLTLVS